MQKCSNLVPAAMAIRKINKNLRKFIKMLKQNNETSLKIIKMQKTSNLVPAAIIIRKINKNLGKFTKILEI